MVHILGVKSTQTWYILGEEVSCLERCPYFRGVFIEGFHCIHMYMYNVMEIHVHCTLLKEHSRKEERCTCNYNCVSELSVNLVRCCVVSCMICRAASVAQSIEHISTERLGFDRVPPAL